MTEGPYYAPGAPERRKVADADTVGTPLVLSGVVVDADCVPVPGALLDFWQADGAGRYDNTGFSLRGVQETGPDGRYRLTTVVPGVYPGRTEHIHVKVRPPGGPTYTTQLYFPGSANNGSDGIFDPAMLVSVDTESRAGVEAWFDVVLPSG